MSDNYVSALLQVLAAVSFCIANIAKDKENLAVITDHGVIHKYVCRSLTLQKFYLCLICHSHDVKFWLVPMSFRQNGISGSRGLFIKQPVLCRLAKLAVTQDDLLRSKLAEVTFNRVGRNSV
jgi:hypothetical protein